MHIEQVNANNSREKTDDSDQTQELGSSLTILRSAIGSLGHVFSDMKRRDNSRCRCYEWGQSTKLTDWVQILDSLGVSNDCRAETTSANELDKDGKVACNLDHCDQWARLRWFFWIRVRKVCLFKSLIFVIDDLRDHSCLLKLLICHSIDWSLYRLIFCYLLLFARDF